MRYLVNKLFLPVLVPIDILGNILFFWTKLKKKPDSIRKVLFIRLEHIGDMIMATPVFESFKRDHPGCEVHVACKNLTAPLLKNNPFVDKIITYDAPWFNKRIEDKNRKLGDLIGELKKEGYNVVFEMHGDPRNNYLAFRTGAYSVGYSCRGFGFLLNKIIDYNNKIQMIKQNLTLIDDFCKVKTEKTSIFVDNEAKRNAGSLIRMHKLSKFIIINPRSGRAEKDLTDNEVVDFITKNKSSKIVIAGSASESEKNKEFERFPNVINLTGKTDLLTLVELVRKAKKIIAPDTGIIHIAKAVGTEFEAIYKTTDKNVWGY